MKTTIPSAEQLLYGTSVDKSQNAVFQPKGDGEDRAVTFEQFYKLVDGYQALYDKKGLSKGDHIVMIGPNSAELAASILAAWRMSLLAIPVDFRMTGQELANVALKVKAKLLLVSKRFQDLEKLESQLEGNKNLMAGLEESADENAPPTSQAKPFSSDFDALMILTSGTTGTPKGAVHDFASLIENLRELGDLAKLDDKTIALLPLPASHIFGLEVLCACLMFGSSVVFSELEPSKFVGALNKYKPQIISGVPLMYGSLLSAPTGSVDLSRARILLSGGAPLPIPMAQEFEQKMGKRINNGYGSTESKIIALNLDGPVESIGKPVPSVKVKIINDQGEIMPEGKEGEIVIDSPHLMKGYFEQPEKSKEVLTEQGYKTGDIGYIKDGYIFISGRSKEMIVVAGNKVFPSEVEEVLLRNPLVAEVAVTGPEHRKLGQIVKATIVVKDEALSKKLEAGNESAKEAREEVLKEVKQFCQDNLKRELRPMEWALRPLSEPLPKTRSGKVDKKELT